MRFQAVRRDRIALAALARHAGTGAAAGLDGACCHIGEHIFGMVADAACQNGFHGAGNWQKDRPPAFAHRRDPPRRQIDLAPVQ